MEFVYSEETKHFSLKALCRTLTQEYGQAISVTSLQSAILARFSTYLPMEQFGETTIHHKERSWRELIRKIQEPHQLSVADFFAAYILGTMAWDVENDEETLIHYRGCLSIWQHLMRSKTRDPDNPESWDSVIQLETTFNERVQYFEKLQPRCLPRASPGVVEAVHDFMDDMLALLMTVIVEVARKEAVGDFNRSEKTDTVVRYVKEQLAAAEFREAIQQVKQISQEFNNEHYDLAICLQRQMKLAVAILRQNTISEGLQTAVVSSIAEDFIEHFKTHIRPAAPVRPKYYVAGLILSGMALSPEELANRNSMS
jgi:hypothetical protein